MSNDNNLVEKVTKIAAETVMDILDKRNKDHKQRRLHNTKLLLKHYREFVFHAQDFDKGNYAIISNPMEELDKEELAIESIKRSKERTYLMVQFITRMLDIYRIVCEQSDKPEDMRRYKIIMELYIDEPKRTIKEIADCHNIENRTLYRDINEAAQTLSALLFGVDGIKMFK